MLYVLYGVLCYVTHGERMTWHTLCNGILAFHAKRKTCGLKLRLIHKQSATNATNAARWASRCVGRWAGLQPSSLAAHKASLAQPVSPSPVVGLPDKPSACAAQPNT